MEIHQQIADMVYYGHWNAAAIDKMSPREREWHHQTLADTKQKEHDARK